MASYLAPILLNTIYYLPTNAIGLLRSSLPGQNLIQQHLDASNKTSENASKTFRLEFFVMSCPIIWVSNGKCSRVPRSYDFEVNCEQGTKKI